MRRILLITIACFSCLLVLGQERVLKATFENSVVYDSLFCQFNLVDRQKVKYVGTYHEKDSSWIFRLPDSIYERYTLLKFIGDLGEDSGISYVHFWFRLDDDKDKTLFTFGNLYWEDTDTLRLQGCLTGRDTVRNDVYLGRDKVVMTQSYRLINPTPELRRGMVNMNKMYVTYKDLPTNQFKDVFAEMIAEAPDSHSSMVYLYDRRHWLPIAQMQELYNMFSEKLRMGGIGRSFQEYFKQFSEKFQDTLLPNSLTGTAEPIVLNEDKYTMLVFSASWCAPCHALIPTLKELYGKKKDVLDIVYVSLDNKEQEAAWKRLLEKEAIPWRALCVDGKVDEMRNKYQVMAIPWTYLIYPRKAKVEKIDVRNRNDERKIEEL